MYALPRGHQHHNQLLAKARPVIRPLDGSEKRELVSPELSYPKPVFHEKNVFHRKNGPTEVLTPQHEEMIKYIQEGWKSVSSSCQLSSSSESDKSGQPSPTSSVKSSSGGNVPDGSDSNRVESKVTYYKSTRKSLLPADFEPFDLETFWGQRLYQNITQTA